MLYINIVKEKGHTVISLDTGKPTNKFQHSLMTKTLSKLGIGGNIYILVKITKIYNKHHAYWRNVRSIPFRVRNKKRMPAFTTSIRSLLEVQVSTIRNKRYKDWKERKMI